MRSLIDFSILQEYNEKGLPRGDKLLALARLVDWNEFLHFSNDLYKSQTAAAHPAASRRGMQGAAA